MTPVWRLALNHRMGGEFVWFIRKSERQARWTKDHWVVEDSQGTRWVFDEVA